MIKCEICGNHVSKDYACKILHKNKSISYVCQICAFSQILTTVFKKEKKK